MKTKVPITYTGSNTENLYVLGIRNGREVKLKVKEIGCHGPIKVEQIAQDDTSYESSEDLQDAKENGELVNNTVYVITENGQQVQYLYYNEQLISLPENSIQEVAGLEYGQSFATFDKLYNAYNNNLLNSKKIYTVTDKGTIEQYIIENNQIIQISGNTNEIITGSIDNLDEKSSTKEDEDGVIDYNLPGVVNGNYRYKNHKNLKEFISDISSMVSGVQMFYGCDNLTLFMGSLDSLEDGDMMFANGPKLTLESIENIAWSLPAFEDSSTHKIHLGAFPKKNQEYINLVREIEEKGWEVSYNSY